VRSGGCSSISQNRVHCKRIAFESGVLKPTAAHLGTLEGDEHTAEKPRAAITAAGIEFIDDDGGGLGVRLRKRSKGKSRK